ncbi:hypothetical protein [Kitasatospora sp. NPDC057223]|jgi:hypothetical protein|uniref:hypothetical protein n=1 Tax=Kitasatospora sp. NPDC057223 TaxID=3346055 RepID=UPI003639C09D
MNKPKRILTALALAGTALAATGLSASSAHAVAGLGEPGGPFAAGGFLLADVVSGGSLPVSQAGIGGLADQAMKAKGH